MRFYVIIVVMNVYTSILSLYKCHFGLCRYTRASVTTERFTRSAKKYVYPNYRRQKGNVLTSVSLSVDSITQKVFRRFPCESVGLRKDQLVQFWGRSYSNWLNGSRFRFCTSSQISVHFAGQQFSPLSRSCDRSFTCYGTSQFSKSELQCMIDCVG